MSRPFSGIYINPNITSPSKAGIGLQPPPPMMRGPMMMDRRRLVGLAIVVGLVFLMIGALLVDASRAKFDLSESAEATKARENLGVVWGRGNRPGGRRDHVDGLGPGRDRRVLRDLGAVPRCLHGERGIVDHDGVADRATPRRGPHPHFRLLKRPTSGAVLHALTVSPFPTCVCTGRRVFRRDLARHAAGDRHDRGWES